MNYRESQVIGSTWVRCRAVTINNPHESKGTPPEVFFQEEQVVAMPGSEFIMRDVSFCSAVFSPTGSVPLLDLATGQPTGQVMTHQQLYQALFSLYMQAATDRDAAQTG